MQQLICVKLCHLLALLKNFVIRINVIPNALHLNILTKHQKHAKTVHHYQHQTLVIYLAVNAKQECICQITNADVLEVLTQDLIKAHVYVQFQVFLFFSKIIYNVIFYCIRIKCTFFRFLYFLEFLFLSNVNFNQRFFIRKKLL